MRRHNHTAPPTTASAPSTIATITPMGVPPVVAGGFGLAELVVVDAGAELVVVPPAALFVATWKATTFVAAAARSTPPPIAGVGK
jgi:hypothetical protein